MSDLPRICLFGLLAISAPLANAQPAFDCGKAEHGAEVAVCESSALSEMDVELARLYALALNGPNMDESRISLLKAEQRGWIKGRDECWKSDLGLERCIAVEYAFRIDAIRTGYANARSEAGASDGPFPYVCDGLGAALSVSFVTTAEPMVVLRWRENAVVLPQVPAASGAKYASSDWFGQAVEFWSKGNEAMFTPPNGAGLTCERDEIG
ncbi:MliC family protein [Tropicimonas marinistellae]|uniref:MliC family protein n=1 Tax=Tropicimonas marinistellae TaxID=1739787 RepID=UPI000AB09E7D|nr:MliC family protein [Tropicimonas marinistellae]